MNNMVQFLCTLNNDEHKDQSDWENIHVQDFKWIHDDGWLPKQGNLYDCGVFMLMNIFVICNSIKLSPSSKYTTFLGPAQRVLLIIIKEK